MPDVVIHACNPNIQEAKAGRLQVLAQAGQFRKILSENHKKDWECSSDRQTDGLTDCDFRNIGCHVGKGSILCNSI